MKAIQKKENKQLYVAVEGRLDTITAPELEAELVLDDVNELAFDFTNVEYISSAGLRLLVKAHKKMAAVGGKMTISGLRPIVKEVFDITGFADKFTFV